MTTYVSIFFMFAGVLGLLWCAKKQKKTPNAQAYAIICLVITVLSGLGVFYGTGMINFGFEISKIQNNEQAFQKAKGYILGKYLAERFPGSTALIITDKDMDKNLFRAASYEGLTEALKNSIKVLASKNLDISLPGVKQEDILAPTEQLMNSGHFNKLIDQYPAANLIISMVGLPDKAGDMTLWKKDESIRPKVALLDGNIFPFKQAILQKYIVAAVTPKLSGFDYDATPPSDMQKAFDIRFQLITHDNVTAIANENPGFFQ